jgi:hypothetical protein
MGHIASGMTSQFANLFPFFKWSFPDSSPDFCMLDFLFLAIIFLIFSYASIIGLGQSFCISRLKLYFFLVDGLYVEAVEAAKSCAALSASLVNLDIWRYDFTAEALKQLPVCQFFNLF